MSSELSASATTKVPVSEITTFHAPETTAPVAPKVPPPAVVEEDDALPQTGSHELVIKPSKGWIGIDWGELFRFRELLYFLVWRDVKVRYKQAVLGIAWAVLEPLMNMIVFTAIFGVAAGLRGQLPSNIPYAVFVFAGLLPWKLFSTALSQGGMSLVSQQNLLTKIYFPRLFVPTATVGSALVDVALQSVVLVGVCAWYHYVPSWQIVFLPLLLVLTVVMALGAAFLLSALTVLYRDFRFLIPVITQIWMYLSFVPIPVPQYVQDSPKWQVLLACNPMFNIVAAFRACLTGQGAVLGFRGQYLATSSLIAAGLFIVGLFYFRRTERKFADIA